MAEMASVSVVETESADTKSVSTSSNESAQKSDSTFYTWLKKSSLEKYFDIFVQNGLKEISHLEDVQEDDAASFGMSKFEFRRLSRVFTEFKKEQSAKGNENSVRSTFKTSSSSVVVSLPKVMKNFLKTRDGMGNVVVKTDGLKTQFKNLYYESPVNPNQEFSNSFILQMAAERMKFSKSLRDCELWCRRERSKRISLLMGTTKSPTLDNWSPYYKKQSAYGIIEIAKARYPEIVALKESDAQPGKKNYEHLCKFFEGCQDALALANSNVAKCKDEIEKTKKGGGALIEGLAEQNMFFSELLGKVQATADEIQEIVEGYESLVEACRKKFGSSISDQLCKRKKKRNADKERKKARKVSTTTVRNEEKCGDSKKVEEVAEVITDTDAESITEEEEAN